MSDSGPWLDIFYALTPPSGPVPFPLPRLAPLARVMLIGQRMKNVSFIAGPRNGGYVNARFAGMHHSAEGRVGLLEAGVALLVLAALIGFAWLVAA